MRPVFLLLSLLLLGCKTSADSDSLTRALTSQGQPPSLLITSLGFPASLAKEPFDEFQQVRSGWDPSKPTEPAAITWSAALTGKDKKIYFKNIAAKTWQSLDATEILNDVSVPKRWLGHIPAHYSWTIRVRDVYLGRAQTPTGYESLMALSVIAYMNPVLENGDPDLNDFNQRVKSQLLVRRGSSSWENVDVCARIHYSPNLPRENCDYNSEIDANPLSFMGVDTIQPLGDSQILIKGYFPVTMGTAEDEVGAVFLSTPELTELTPTDIGLPLAEAIATPGAFWFRTNNPCRDRGGVFVGTDHNTKFLSLFSSIPTRLGSDWAFLPSENRLLLTTSQYGSSTKQAERAESGGLFEVDVTTLRVSETGASKTANVKATFSPFPKAMLPSMLLCRDATACLFSAMSGGGGTNGFHTATRDENGSWRFGDEPISDFRHGRVFMKYPDGHSALTVGLKVNSEGVVTDRDIVVVSVK